MDYSKNSVTNLVILSLFLATVVLLCSWEPFADKSVLLSHSHSSDQAKSPLVQKDELEIALEKASMANKTVIISVINKAYVEPHADKYPTMLDLFLEGFWAGKETRPLVNHLLVVSMDRTAHEKCLFRRLNCYTLAAENGGGNHFAGEKVYMSKEFIEMMWRRTRFLMDVLQRGYSFIFTDTDVLWLRNPFTRLSKNTKLDLQISNDVFNGNQSSEKNLINTGFYFVRSNNKTILMFKTWYDLRKNSTGKKEQDVLDNLVRNGIIEELGLNVRFLNTLYFSGFCKNSEDVRVVVTVHANCCRSIKAKVEDLERVLGDWRKFKAVESIGLRGSRNSSSNFQWSKHISCINSWHHRN